MNIKTILFLLLFFLVNISFAQYESVDNENYNNEEYLMFWKENADNLLNNSIFRKYFSGSLKSISIPAFFDISTDNYSSYKIDTATVVFNDKSAQILCYFARNTENTSAILSIYHYHESFFKKVLQDYNLPESFSILPFALSSMNCHANSRCGGVGLWQLKYSEARFAGLRVDSIIDERLMVEKSTYAAAIRLSQLYKQYKDISLTISAYVCGPTHINKYINKCTTKMPLLCSDIISAYTASIVLLNNKADLGLEIIPINSIIDKDTVTVSEPLHFMQISTVLQISIDKLRFLNPQFINDIVPVSKEGNFAIYLPKAKIVDFYMFEDSIYNYRDSIYFKSNIIHKPPKPGSGNYIAKGKIPKSSKLVYYKLKSGDNLGYISSWFNVSVRQIKSWNGISNPRKIRAGQKLKIYVPKAKYSFYNKLDKLSFAQKQARIGKVTSVKENKTEEIGFSDYFFYTVKQGDSPYKIAKKYPGVSAENIMKWNNISDAGNIRPGDKLKIKKD